MADPTEELERLYGLPLEEFISARDQLSAALRERGDRGAAARVKKLRRPSVSAWTVNQLVRRSAKDVQELLSVGEDVRAASRGALSGGGASSHRDLSQRRRRIVDRLLDRAAAVLADAGHATGRSTLDKVGDTLMAATVDEKAGEAVRAGRLERELAPRSGFEELAERMPVPSAAKRDRQARERTKRAESEARSAEEAAEDAEREARRLEQQARRSQEDAERARRKADRAAERARELRRKADESASRTGR